MENNNISHNELVAYCFDKVSQERKIELAEVISNNDRLFKIVLGIKAIKEEKNLGYKGVQKRFIDSRNSGMTKLLGNIGHTRDNIEN